jgi:hypothetical protein
MKPKPFRIFRTGTHTDSAGGTTTFTAEQLQATVKAYNEGEWRAPVVVGHPKGHAPAYGWVGQLSLSAAGDVICDDLDKLNPDFAELMKSGAYRNRSASWYAPDHPSNPTPGVWQLRHLGMLGAQPPALKGLGDVEFADDGLVIEFGDYTTSTIGSIFRRLRDGLLAKWGIEETDKLLPAFLVEDIEAAGRQAIEASVPNYSESDMTPEEIAALQAQANRATQLETDLAAANAARTAAETAVASFTEQQATRNRAVTLATCTAAITPLVTAGKVTPEQVTALAEFAANLDDADKVIEFGEHTGENKLTARAMFLQTLESRPSTISYAEHTGDLQLPGSMKPAELAQKAREYQEGEAAKGRTISTTIAVDAVLAGKTSG